jgi:hypothetical protein
VIVGEVRSVEKGGSQSGLTTAAAPGAITLTVEMAEGNFNEDGGQLRLNDNTYDYTAIDVDADTITLTAPLPVAATIDDPIQSIDAGNIEIEWTALVAIDDGDPIPATIPTALIGYFPEGTYDQPVQVAIQLSGDSYEVASQPLRDASFDGGAVWNPHAFRDVTAQNVADSFWARINSWSVGEADGVTVGATSSTTYTIQYPGVYFISVQVAFATNGTGVRRVRLMRNDTDQIAYNSTAADAGSATYVLTTRELRLVEDDTISVDVWQTSGATLALYVVGSTSTFAMHRVSV